MRTNSTHGARIVRNRPDSQPPAERGQRSFCVARIRHWCLTGIRRASRLGLLDERFSYSRDVSLLLYLLRCGAGVLFGISKRFICETPQPTRSRTWWVFHFQSNPDSNGQYGQETQITAPPMYASVAPVPGTAAQFNVCAANCTCN
jgi:hypothetical protein